MRNATRLPSHQSKRSPMYRMVGSGDRVVPPLASSRPPRCNDSDDFRSCEQLRRAMDAVSPRPLTLSPRKPLDANSTVEECFRMVDHMEWLIRGGKLDNVRLRKQLADAQKTIDDLTERLRKHAPPEQDDEDDLYS
jgi:hypothetical protein